MIKRTENTEELLLKLINTYPLAQAEDIFKFLFQSSFGCEHLVTDEKSAFEYIIAEYESSDRKALPLTEALDGAYKRIYLSCLNCGLKADTLAKLFCLSAKTEAEGRVLIEDKLKIAVKLVKEGRLPFDENSFFEQLIRWESSSYSALHHSDVYRNTYRPSYRVISNRYADFLEIFTAIDKLLRKEHVIVAVEGGSASGKTTLSEVLEEVYDCNVFHMDDFFLRPEQRTPQRFAEIGGNVDRERFEEEVLCSLVKGETVRYRPFDCSSMSLGDEITVNPKRLTVIEGVYSTHPAFSRYYDLALFLDIDPDHQRTRIIKRNSTYLADRFFNEWIPLENRYFAASDIRNRVDMVFKVK